MGETEEQFDDLPPLDGDENDPSEGSVLGDDTLDDDDVLTPADDGLDPFDDSTGEADPVEELAEEERSWLTDAEPADGLELGAFDLEEDAQLATAIGDDEEPGVDGEDFGLDEAGGAGGPVLLDGGEEGPSGPDEELREADLPALDADEEGDLDDAVLEDVALDDDAPLPWDPNPWERAGIPLEIGAVLGISCGELGVLAWVGQEKGAGDTTVTTVVRVDLEGGIRPLTADDDHAKEKSPASPEPDEKTLLSRLGLTKTGDLRVSAETKVNEDSLVALVSRIAGRAWLVQVQQGPEARARIVAEVGGAGFGDDPEILALAWDETRGVAWVGGLFGLLAFQPRLR